MRAMVALGRSTNFGFPVLLGVVLLSGCARTRAPASSALSADRSLDDTVRAQLSAESFLPRGAIHTRSKQGIVTLEGTVTNLLARRRAQEIVEATRGVRGVINLLEVEPETPRSDLTLQRSAVEALLYHPATDAFDIRVQVADGRAKLTGVVSSATEAELATRVVESVEGLRDVANELSVATTAVRGDREIQAEVEARLHADAKLDDNLLRVRVEDGYVKLSGTLGRLTERNRAASDAWVRGVKQVDVEGVEIDPELRDEDRRVESPPLSDAEVEQAVELALSYDPRVSGQRVDAEALKGALVLTGVVDRVEAKRAAGDDARATLGVSHVDNRIIVEPQPLADHQIAVGVRNAIERHPFVDRFRILVKAEDGVVQLDGTVASEYERSVADQLAAQAPGVRAVQNRLTLRSDVLKTLRGDRVPSSHAPPSGGSPAKATRQDIPGQGLHVLPADAIVLARCQQQQRCGAIGPGERYSDFEACRGDVGRSQQTQLDELACRAGVSESNLELCLVEVRTADCATPQADAEWLGASCSALEICRSAP